MEILFDGSVKQKRVIQKRKSRRSEQEEKIVKRQIRKHRDFKATTIQKVYKSHTIRIASKKQCLEILNKKASDLAKVQTVFRIKQLPFNIPEKVKIEFLNRLNFCSTESLVNEIALINVCLDIFSSCGMAVHLHSLIRLTRKLMDICSLHPDSSRQLIPKLLKFAIKNTANIEIARQILNLFHIYTIPDELGQIVDISIRALSAAGPSPSERRKELLEHLIKLLLIKYNEQAVNALRKLCVDRPWFGLASDCISEAVLSCPHYLQTRVFNTLKSVASDDHSWLLVRLMQPIDRYVTEKAGDNSEFEFSDDEEEGEGRMDWEYSLSIGGGDSEESNGLVTELKEIARHIVESNGWRNPLERCIEFHCVSFECHHHSSLFSALQSNPNEKCSCYEKVMTFVIDFGVICDQLHQFLNSKMLSMSSRVSLVTSMTFLKIQKVPLIHWAFHSWQFDDENIGMLALFAELSSRALLAADDEDLFVRGIPLNVEVLKIVPGVLKDVIWKSVWMGTKIIDEAQLKSVSKLFSKLHSRHCRRAICDDREFSFTELTINASGEAQLKRELLNDPLSVRAEKILTICPFVFPFELRAQLFMTNLGRYRNNHRGFMGRGSMNVRVQRDHIYEDAMKVFQEIQESDPAAFRRSFFVIFTSEFGYQEAGIDGGGLLKEFLSDLSEKAFDPRSGLFDLTEDSMLYPSANASRTSNDYLNDFRFIGQIVGKCLFEKILIKPKFAPFFLNKLLAVGNFFDDLASLNPEVYRHLIWLKSYEGSFEDLGLTFSTVEETFDEKVEVELIPGGKDIPVTAANKHRFIYLLVHYRLNVFNRTCTQTFLRGIRDVISVEWLRMFNQEELQWLISGKEESFDVTDLMHNVNLGPGLSNDDPYMQWFWQIIDEMDNDHKRKFLQFVTSCPRAPLLGFGHMYPLFGIQCVLGESERLPTSSTCMNLLKLPRYETKEELKHKLYTAITNAVGFELS